MLAGVADAADGAGEESGGQQQTMQRRKKDAGTAACARCFRAHCRSQWGMGQHVDDAHVLALADKCHKCHKCQVPQVPTSATSAHKCRRLTHADLFTARS